ncbi:MAG: hypothetical protein ACE5Q6_08345, partial [Dehalococcoidia bacterium]
MTTVTHLESINDSLAQARALLARDELTHKQALEHAKQVQAWAREQSKKTGRPYAEFWPQVYQARQNASAARHQVVRQEQFISQLEEDLFVEEGRQETLRQIES